MAENNLDILLNTVGNSIRFNDRYGLQYFEANSFNKIDDLLSLMRRNKEINSDEYHKIYKIYRHYYLNFYKIKNLESIEPRKIAQQFIGRKKIREFILKRDNRKCLKCGNTLKLQLDHIIPISKGGENKLSNLQTLCNSCNSKKRDNYYDYR